jgi:hypothetical protein
MHINEYTYLVGVQQVPLLLLIRGLVKMLVFFEIHPTMVRER